MFFYLCCKWGSVNLAFFIYFILGIGFRFGFGSQKLVVTIFIRYIHQLFSVVNLRIILARLISYTWF